MAVNQYYAPTHVYFGKDAELETGKVLGNAGYGKVLIHYGSGSVVRSGLLKRVEQTLEDEGIPYIELKGAQPNPRLSLVRKGIELGRREGVDLILAVGGGSAIDSAKAIALGMKYDGDVWDLYMAKAKPVEVVPVATVLTLSATGSEMSNSSVITNDEKNPYDKVGINNDLIRPVFSFLNPELTYTVSEYQTGSGSADIIMHSLERFFHSGAGLDVTDEIAASVIRTVIRYTPVALKNPGDYEARANIMWAGSVSHNDMTNACNATRGDWDCHRLEHELSALYDVAHGAGLASIWGSWARYVCSVDYSRFAKLGELVFGITDDDVKRAAGKTIESMEAFFREIGMPVNLHELGLELKDEDIKILAEKASLEDSRTLGDFKVLRCRDMYEIFSAANRLI